MLSSKLPIKLVWGLFRKIFEDLDIEKLQKSFFSSINIKPENCYELILGLLLKLLSETDHLHKSLSDGVSNDLIGINLDKTVSENTLRDCNVYSKSYKYKWNCAEHTAFLKAIEICFRKSSSNFKKQDFIKKFIDNLLAEKCIDSLFVDMSVSKALSIITTEYNTDTFELSYDSILRRNEEVYTNLCRFSYLVLASESHCTDSDGSLNINYDKIDWFIVQQYGVREVWNVINSQKYLLGRKHREFQPVIYKGNSPYLNPDAVYIFDNCDINDIVIDVKLYGVSYLNASGYYRFGNIVGKMISYKVAYPDYIKKYPKKPSRKNISFDEVNTWVLHFRANSSSEEKKFSGTRLDLMNIGVYLIDMFDGCTVKDLDEQIKNFVLNYLLV